MRVGRNPTKAAGSRDVEVMAPPPISVGLLTHAPFLAGYHADALDVIRLAVLSARANAGRPVHLLVVDNASCGEVREWLLGALDDGTIDQLVLNGRNLGKVTAVSQILRGAPGPDVVYSDGDLRFLPDWLAPMLAVRDAFPEAGVIGGGPAPRGFPQGADEQPDLPVPELDGVVVEEGRFVSDAYLRGLLTETGFEGERLEERLAVIQATPDLRLRRGDATALWGSPHCQYLVPAAALAAFGPQVGTSALNTAETHALDRALTATGFVRVSVNDAVYHHVGNRLDDEDRRVLAELGGGSARGRERRRLTSDLWRLPPMRRFARRLHHWSFRVIYEPPKAPATPNAAQRRDEAP